MIDDHADSDLCAAFDQLDDLRDKLDTALVAAESERAARGRAVNTAQLLTALLERAIAELVRAGHGDIASLLSEQLQAVLRDRA